MRSSGYQGTLILIMLLLMAACVRQAYDRPPDTSKHDPKIPVTHTIAQLKAMNGLYNATTGGDTTLISGDVVISGIVCADDRSGNLYKQIVIQDSSGGLFVNIDGYSLYSRFPVGRRLYLLCKGLYLGYNGGTMELGAALTEQLQVKGLSGAQIDEHICKGPVGNAVEDTSISFAQAKAIGASGPARFLVGRLVTIRDVQFTDTHATYADPAATTNRMIQECAESSSTLVVRTSNYCDFHTARLAKGRGTITGIYTVYQSANSYTPQLMIRDTADVKMTGARCGAVPPLPFISIDSLRRLFPGSGVLVLPALSFSGTVISDLSKGNVSPGNFVVQDKSRKGVILYLSNGSFSLGDSLLIDATGAKLQLYNGALELTGVAPAKISKIAQARTVHPVQLTIAQLHSDFVSYESILVKVLNATVSGGGTYSGNKILGDGTGIIMLYTSPSATFSGLNVPTTPKTFVGIATVYTPNEIKLRDPALDVY